MSTNIVPFESHFERKNEARVPFKEITIGSKFRFGESTCIKTQEGFTSPVIKFEETPPQPCKFNFMFLSTNRGTFGWLSPDQCVEVIAPHREDS